MNDSAKTAVLFSGQGSQYVGMLKDIYINYPEANQIIDQADEILGYKISSICFDGPVDTLKETRYTQPALFLHSSVVLQLIRNNFDFDACAGHSVGEYAALFASGVLSFEDALKLVSLRGELMFKAGEIEPGTMFAVINLSDDIVETLCKDLSDAGNGNIIVPANYNSPGQIVISGSQQYLRDNASKFKEAGARMVSELQVSGAFHSPLLRHAKEELEIAINNIQFNDALKPVYSNVFASPLIKGNDIKEALVLQLMSPVKWSQTLFKMKENGFNKFVEVGPGNVLQGLAKRTLTDIEILGIDKSEDIEKILA